MSGCRGRCARGCSRGGSPAPATRPEPSSRIGRHELLGRPRIGGRLEDDRGAGPEVACQDPGRLLDVGEVGVPVRQRRGHVDDGDVEPGAARGVVGGLVAARGQRGASGRRRSRPPHRSRRRRGASPGPRPGRSRPRRSRLRRHAWPAPGRHIPGPRRRPVWPPRRWSRRGPSHVRPSRRAGRHAGLHAETGSGSASTESWTPTDDTSVLGHRPGRTGGPARAGRRVGTWRRAAPSKPVGDLAPRRRSTGTSRRMKGCGGGEDLLVGAVQLLVELLPGRRPIMRTGISVPSSWPDSRIMRCARSRIRTGSPISSMKISPPLRQHRRLEHELDRLLDAHEEPGHAGVGDRDRPTRGDLAGEGGDHAAPAAEDVAEAHDRVGGTGRGVGQHDFLGHPLGRAHDADGPDRLVASRSARSAGSRPRPRPRRRSRSRTR